MHNTRTTSNKKTIGPVSKARINERKPPPCGETCEEYWLKLSGKAMALTTDTTPCKMNRQLTKYPTRVIDRDCCITLRPREPASSARSRTLPVMRTPPPFVPVRERKRDRLLFPLTLPSKPPPKS